MLLVTRINLYFIHKVEFTVLHREKQHLQYFHSLTYMPFKCRKPATRPQNKISTITKTRVPHFFEWSMTWNSDSVSSTCKSYLLESQSINCIKHQIIQAIDYWFSKPYTFIKVTSACSNFLQGHTKAYIYIYPDSERVLAIRLKKING